MQHQPKYTETAPSPLDAYRSLVESGRVAEDKEQLQVVESLESMHRQLGKKSGVFGWFGKKQPSSAGFYIWGNVGRGKSMLMDLFFQTAPLKKKRRIHFHAFMQEVHADIHAWRQKKQETNPVDAVADKIARKTGLLCLDEFQVTDVADAMILSQLFTRLLDDGVIVLTTSNFPPESLYADGLQRERFLKFIDLVNERLDIVPLNSKQDYRLKQLAGFHQVYFHPLDDASTHHILETKELLACHPPIDEVLNVQGRPLRINKLAGGVGEASFTELCEQPLGPADYLAIARRFHTFFLYGIPTLTPEKRNEAKRFVTLIDAFYEHKVKLICTAAAAPPALYPEGHGAFEFQRTVSRLMEMQSQPYLEASHTE